MGTAAKEPVVTRTPSPRSPWGRLPPRIRVLYVSTPHRTGGWLAEAFAADRAAQVVLEEASGLSAGLTRLRDEVFDAVLVSHEPGELDALELAEGLRAGGSDEPLIILGEPNEQELSPLCYEVGADAYICVHTTTTRTLIWTIARSVERHKLLRENHRLAQAERHRLRWEHQEAERLLDEQRAMIRDLQAMPAACLPVATLRQAMRPADAGGEDGDDEVLAAAAIARHAAADAPLSLPPALVTHYRELLRAYVIMGAGNLAGEMSALGDLLASAGVSAPQTVQLHLHVLEELLRGLGNRSARHVLSRADLLVLEVMIHLGEGYRRRLYESHHPPVQLFLPGFLPRPGCQ